MAEAPRGRRVSSGEFFFVDVRCPAILNQPSSGDHHPVSPVCTAQHQGRQRIVMPGVTQFVEPEQGQIGLCPRRDPADIVSAQAAGAPRRCPTQGIPVADDRRAFTKSLQHQGATDLLDSI